DGDGKPEIVVANSGSDSLTILQDTATGASPPFSSSTSQTLALDPGSVPVSICAARLARTNNYDLAVANSGSTGVAANSITIITNATNTFGSFLLIKGTPKPVGTKPICIRPINPDNDRNLLQARDGVPRACGNPAISL